jgi:CIC family chloride channel protein
VEISRAGFSGAERRFWVLVVATGAAAGLGAVLLLWLLRAVQRLAWGATESTSFLPAVQSAGTAQRVLVPALAGVLVAVVTLLARSPVGGHGTAGIIEAIWLKEGLLSLPRALLRGTTSIIAVAMGASLGREGALIQTGAAFGSALGRRLGVSPQQARLLVACGAASGIAAAYNVPIGAALFGLEVLLGSFALELLGPIVASCVVATLLSRTLVASHPTYVIPHYELLTLPEVLLSLAVFGPLLGVASAAFVKVLDGFSATLSRVPVKVRPFLPIPAMAALGAAAIAFPELLGNGYETANAALLGQVGLSLLLALPLLKLLSTALCSGAGVPGGLFTPSLFVGALLGGGAGELIHRVWPASAPSGAYALVGMAGILAGTTHAAVSSVLIVFELTGNYDVILPLMLVCAVSAAVSRRLVPDSIYTSVLRRRNVEPPDLPKPGWLG